jgi:hypothetical protein
LEAELSTKSSFVELSDKIYGKWKYLVQVDFRILADGIPIENDDDILQNHKRTLKVEILSEGFSTIDSDEVIKWARISGVEVDNSMFQCSDIDESDDRVKTIIDHTVAQLRYTDALYGPITKCAESSVREYISAILSAAAGIAQEVKLSAEKEITGRKASGPVDYCMMYKDFLVVIAEAKKDDLEKGVVQNTAQLVASREDYLFNVNCKKRGYMEFAGQIEQVPSTGIVTTGKDWLLMRYLLLPTPAIVRSEVYLLPISTTESDTILRSHVLKIVGMIISALKLQKEAVDNNEFMKKNKIVHL